MKNYVLLFIGIAFFTKNVTAQNKIESRQTIKLKEYSEDRILKNGFWIDLGVGVTIFHEKFRIFFNPKKDPHLNSRKWKTRYAFNMNFGHKWYFPKNDRYQFGFQITWLGGGVNLYRGIYIDLGGLGFCSLFRLNENTGIEANFNAGPSLYITDIGYSGIQLNVEFKYRVGYFTVGTKFRYFTDIYNGISEVLSTYNILLTLGVKF